MLKKKENRFKKLKKESARMASPDEPDHLSDVIKANVESFWTNQKNRGRFNIKFE